MRFTIPLFKGPFIGPRGGKWADSAHTISWRTENPRTGVIVVKDAEIRKTVDKLVDGLQFMRALGQYRIPEGKRVATALSIKAADGSWRHIGVQLVGTGKSRDPRGVTGVHSIGATTRDASHTVVLKVAEKEWGGWPPEELKQKLRSVLSHELTHAADPSTEKRAIQRTVEHFEGQPDRLAVKQPGQTTESWAAYVNQKHEVTASMQQIARDLLDPAGANPLLKDAAKHAKDPKAPPPESPMAMLYDSARWRQTEEHYTPENRKRILKMAARIREAILSGKLKPMKKGLRFTLRKAALLVGHISTYRDGTRHKKQASGKWIQLADERQMGLFDPAVVAVVRATPGSHESIAKRMGAHLYKGQGTRVNIAAHSRAAVNDFKEALGETLGRQIDDKDIAALIGAPYGSEITLRWSNLVPERMTGSAVYSLSATVYNNDLELNRTISTNGYRTEVYNNALTVITDSPGMGTRIFASQVAACAEAGVDAINTHAVGHRNSSYNGYYTWARLGYQPNEDLNESRDLPSPWGLRDENAPADSLAELMETQKGRDWWKRHGNEWHGTFDLTEGSRAMKTIDAYVGARDWSTVTKGRKGGENLILTAEDERILNVINAAFGAPRKMRKMRKGGLPTNHVSTYSDGSKHKKNADGTWSPVSEGRSEKVEIVGSSESISAALGDKLFTGADVEVEWVEHSEFEAVRDEIERGLGFDLTDDNIAALCGAPNGSGVRVEVDSHGKLGEHEGGLGPEASGFRVSVENDDVAMERVIYSDGDRVVIYNSSFWVEGAKGQGLGVRAFASQVAACSTAGVEHIICRAAGTRTSSDNGYYTWARFGYQPTNPDQITDMIRRRSDDDMNSWPPSTKIPTLMATEAGRSWWTENGFSWDAKFDLSKGSRSMKTIDAYVREKKWTAVAKGRGTKVPFYLTPDDERILDAVNARFAGQPKLRLKKGIGPPPGLLRRRGGGFLTGHITTYADGTRRKKVAPGKWVWLRSEADTHKRTEPGEQMDLLGGKDENNPNSELPLYYASGSNSPGLMIGLARLGRDLGVAVDQIKREKVLRTLETIHKHNTDVRVFVDSGAFSEFNEPTGDEPPTWDEIPLEEWHKRLDIYERLAASLGEHVAVVAPDKVAHQEDTLKRMKQHAPQMKRIRELGAEILIPLQTGDIDIVEMERKALDALGADGFDAEGYVPAIPYKKAKMPLPVLLDYVERRKPKALHILGIGRNREGMTIFDAIKKVSPDTDVRLDSVLVRGGVGRGSRNFSAEEHAAGRSTYVTVSGEVKQAKRQLMGVDPAKYPLTHAQDQFHNSAIGQMLKDDPDKIVSAIMQPTWTTTGLRNRISDELGWTNQNKADLRRDPTAFMSKWTQAFNSGALDGTPELKKRVRNTVIVMELAAYQEFVWVPLTQDRMAHAVEQVYKGWIREIMALIKAADVRAPDDLWYLRKSITRAVRTGLDPLRAARLAVSGRPMVLRNVGKYSFMEEEGPMHKGRSRMVVRKSFTLPFPVMVERQIVVDEYLHAELQKAERGSQKAGAKYKRRIPLGTDPKTGRMRYRYIYSEASLAHKVQEGERINLGDGNFMDIEDVRENENGHTFVTWTDDEGNRHTASVAGITKVLHDAYGDSFKRAAEKVATRWGNAQQRLAKIKEMGLDSETGVTKAIYDRLYKQIDRAKADPHWAAHLSMFLTKQTLTPSAQSAVIQALRWGKNKKETAEISANIKQIVRAASNLASVDGDEKAGEQHIAQALALRWPGAKLTPSSFTQMTDQVTQQMDVENAKLEVAVGILENAMNAGGAHAASAVGAFTEGLTDLTSGPQLRVLADAFPGLRNHEGLRRYTELTSKTQAILTAAQPDPEKAHIGSDCRFYVANREGHATPMRARYKIVEADDLIASHTAPNFQPHPSYPSGVQERLYHTDANLQRGVHDRARSFHADFVHTDNPDAVNGPPMVTTDGICIGGNSRAMTQQMLYSSDRGDRVKDHLTENAARFGLTAEAVGAMKSPILVRELVDVSTESHSKTQLRELVRRANESFTMSMDPRSLQVARALRLDSAAIDALTRDMRPEETLNSFLSSSRSKRENGFLERLRAVGIIDDRNESQFVRSDGMLNADGRVMISRIMVGKMVPDPDVLGDTPHGLMESLGASAPPIISTQSAAGYDLTGALKLALSAHQHASMEHAFDGPAPKDALPNLIGQGALGDVAAETRGTDAAGERTGQGLPSQHPIANDQLAQEVYKTMTLVTGQREMPMVFRAYAEAAANAASGDMFGNPTPAHEILQRARDLFIQARESRRPARRRRAAAPAPAAAPTPTPEAAAPAAAPTPTPEAAAP